MTHETISTHDLLKAWTPFRKVLGFSAVRNARDYKRAAALVDRLVDEVGEDENHPLADLLDYLSNLVADYEEKHTNMPDAAPRDVLRLLMDQHGLKQSDLADCAPQGRISDILSGRREISKALAKALAERFGVGVEVFV